MSRAAPAFADLPIRTKGMVVVAIPVLALLVMLAAVLFVQRDEQDAERWVRHTLEVRQDLQLAFMLLIDAESATRGYLQSRQPDWLEPFDRAQHRLPAVLSDLEKSVADNPTQLARAREIRQAAARRLLRLQQLQQLVAPGGDLTGFSSALDRSKTSMDRVRESFGQMQASEEALLAQRSAHAQTVRAWLYGLIVAAALAGLAGALVAALLFGRHVAERVRRLSADSARLAHRQPMPAPDPARDELGQLSARLYAADRLLSEREGHLRETQTFLEHLVDTSPTVIFRQDPVSLHVLYVSPNVERVLGYTPQEILSEPDFWMSRVHPDDSRRVRDLDAHAFAARSPQMELEYRFQHKDGGYRWLDSFVRIEYDASGQPVEFLGHRLDITRRKLAEEVLREREASLDAANKELEAFSYSVSHDLRAPLRSIDGFSQALIEDYADKLDPSGHNYLQRVRAATQRMGELIDDLLNLSRVTRAPLRRTRVNLSALAESIAESLRHNEPQRAAEFVIAPSLEDHCDANLLRVVLENLLGNAWKFTSKHPAARIEFSRSDGAYFVRDDGAGFDSAYKAKLFGAFQRLHHANDFAGTGIGLATVQRIVRRHGGKVWAEGAPEKGATFYFTLGETPG
jgi:PAS domain S-box-containing protein